MSKAMMTLKALRQEAYNRLPGGAARPSHDDVKSIEEEQEEDREKKGEKIEGAKQLTQVENNDERLHRGRQKENNSESN